MLNFTSDLSILNHVCGEKKKGLDEDKFMQIEKMKMKINSCRLSSHISLMISRAFVALVSTAFV